MRQRTPLMFMLADDRVVLTGVLGALGIVLGSTLVWAIVPTALAPVQESGLEANGKLTLAAGIVAFVFVLTAVRLRGRDLAIGGAVFGAIVIAIGASYIADLKNASARVVARMLSGGGTLEPGAVGARFGARPGPGVWLVVAGGVAVTLASIALLLRARRRPA